MSGTYFQTTEDVYQGGSMPSYTKQVLILDTAATELREANDGANNNSAITTYTTSGTMLTITAACGASGMLTVPYTATATQFIFFDTNNGRVETYAKQ